MTSLSRQKAILICLIGLLLGSCSYSYDIRAVARNGGLVLIFDGGGIFSRRLPHVNSLGVESVGEPSTPVWELQAIGPNGPELEEVTYGRAALGMGITIGPVRLQIGRLYRVNLISTDGGSSSEFVISDDGEVLNLRR